MASCLVFIFGLFSLASHGYCGDDNSYANYKMIQIKPQTPEELEAMLLLEEKPVGHILKMSHGINDTLDLLVSPQMKEMVLDYAKSMKLQYAIKSEDYSRTLQNSTRADMRRSYRDDNFDIFGYNSYPKLLKFQRDLAKTYPGCVENVKVGNSYENRPIVLTKISSNRRAINPVIFIDAGIHAREWVAPSMATYLMQQVAGSCMTDEQDNQNMLSGVDWYIMPMVNPDGYEYSRRRNRMWRKTRSKYVASCYGVDGNRNYGFKWAKSGTSSNPCDPQTYAGPVAFSEPETRIVRDIMLSNAQRIKLYVSLHAYGNYLVYPWGYTADSLPERWQDLDVLAKKVSTAIASAGGQELRVMSAGKWYAAAGGSDDYAFGVAKIPYSYTMELTDGYEFQYPEDLLEGALPQFYEGFKVFKKHIQNNYPPQRVSEINGSGRY